MKKTAILLLFLFSFSLVFAQGVTSPSSVPVEERIYKQEDMEKIVRLLRNAPQGATTYWFATQLIGIPYVGATLEVGEEEPLVINLRQLDCTTLVETCLALYLTHRDACSLPLPILNAAEKQRLFDAYCAQLQRIRYWGGVRDGYLSRLHYFTWWMHDNMDKGIVQDVAMTNCQLAPVNCRLSYMTTHPSAYKHLNGHPERVEIIGQLEKRWQGEDGLYLPQEELVNVTKANSPIRDGDIIAIVTKKQGLDYSHLGFASWHKDGRLHLLNASSIHKKVVDEPKTLLQYLREHPSSIGIRVLRVK